MQVAEKWTLAILDDPDELTGRSVVEVIALMQRAAGFRYVIVDGLEGAGVPGVIADLNERIDEPMKIEELVKIFKGVRSVEWGDFFLFKEYPNGWEDDGEEPYESVIARTDTTVRAVDGRYLYVYTFLPEIEQAVSKNYTLESRTCDCLEDLPHPY
jgi:hypothetical protein